MSPRQMMWAWEATIFGPATLCGWAVADGWPVLAVLLGLACLYSTHTMVEYVDGAVKAREGWERDDD